MTFAGQLHGAVRRFGPLCVGIDPHPQLLESWGCGDDVDGLERFADTCVRAFAGDVALVKPQVAFFERFGSGGVRVLEQTVAQLRESGTLCLLDAKRGDIGSTMAAYAAAYLGDRSPLAADAVTLSPYLGVGSLRPAFELAERCGRGTFVLALTSNPEAHDLQHARAGGRSVAAEVIDAVTVLNRAGASGPEAGSGSVTGSTGADAGWGSVGLVIGATVGGALRELGLVEPLVASRAPILAPGLGAQGATVADIRATFGDALGQVIPVSARAVLRHGPDVMALRVAVARTQEQVASLRA